jgi:electron transfer flavoprotein beta subunit
MGVAGVYLIKDEEMLVQDTLRVATVLARAAQTISAREGESQWDLIICGEASADQYNQQVGPRLATALSLPCVTYATSLVLNNGTLRAERGIEQRLETLQLPTPAVVTVGTEINVARMPTVLQIMGAGRKPVVELALRDLVGMDIERLKALPSIEDVDVFAPPSARKQITIKGESTDDIVRELLRRLGSDGEVTF